MPYIPRSEWTVERREKRRALDRAYKKKQFPKERMKAYYWKTRDKQLIKIRKSKLKTKYKLSLEDFQNLFEKQNGVCAICKEPETAGRLLAIDHNHETGEIRGLLCTNCNLGLGKFKDSPELLRIAQEYVSSNSLS
jgi:Recombination endonuclease VII